MFPHQETSTSSSLLTIWQDGQKLFQSPQKVDTIVHIFIKNYLLVPMYPRYILSNNGTELKNQLMDDILQQPDINFIFSNPIPATEQWETGGLPQVSQANTQNLFENDPNNWDQYLNQVLNSYFVTPHIATAETPFFLFYGWDSNLPLHQLLEPIKCFLGNPVSGF